MGDASDPPVVGESFSVQRMMETLDHDEMIALAILLAEWSESEPGLGSAMRASWCAMSRELVALAEHLGPDWRASCREDPPDLIALLARTAVQDFGLRSR